MNYYTISAALLITLIITVFFSLFSKRSMRGLWVFFLLVFLTTLTGQFWITPFGPVTRGIAWIPLFIVAVFFSFFIFALSPPVPLNKKAEAKSDEEAFIVIGFFFWLILVLLLIAIVVGYYRLPYPMPVLENK